MPNHYVNKRVKVEARQLTQDNVDEIVRWCAGERREEKDPFDTSKKFAAINMPTLNGVVRVSEGDYVIQSENGNFRQMSRYAFESEFEAE